MPYYTMWTVKNVKKAQNVRNIISNPNDPKVSIGELETCVSIPNINCLDAKLNQDL